MHKKSVSGDFDFFLTGALFNNLYLTNLFGLELIYPSEIKFMWSGEAGVLQTYYCLRYILEDDQVHQADRLGVRGMVWTNAFQVEGVISGDWKLLHLARV
jgi:hypothetical protein